MTEKEVLNIINQSKEKNVSEKEICVELNINYKSLYYFKKKYNLLENTRGKSVNSRKHREYYINDNFFEIPNLINSYWAGFIAADGNISKDYRQLSFGLASKDKIILENLLKDTNSNYIIRDYKSHGHDCVSITIMSPKICNDLLLNFNITDNKSLTLIHPNLENELIDAFIIGYLDGDGSIGLYESKKQKSLQISLLGTYSICEWIKYRFSTLYEKEIGTIFHDKRHNENTFSYTITDKSARFIFEHLYTISVPKLNRKWNIEKSEYCINYQRVKKDLTKYNEILKLKIQGLNQTDISKIMGCSQANISWYYKQEYFINMEKIEKQIKIIENDLINENTPLNYGKDILLEVIEYFKNLGHKIEITDNKTIIYKLNDNS